MSSLKPFDSRFLARLEELRLSSRQRYTGQVPGERPSPRHGSSLEFVDFRPYTQGDDPHRVDWNIYARLDRLVVKLFSEERDLCLHLLIDTSASMGFGTPAKLESALRVAAALGYIALCNHERLALGLFSNRVHRTLRPRRGRRQIYPVLRLLADIEGEGRTALGASLSRYAWESRAPGLAIVISDLLDADASYRSGVRALLSRGFEVQVLHLLSDDELDPPLEGDLRLVDWEHDDPDPAKDVTIEARTLATYRDNIKQFCDDAQAFCLRRSVPYLRISSSVALEDLLFRRLRERRFLL